MLSRVLFISQRQAEKMKPPKASILISIVNSQSNPAVFRRGWGSILRISFDDVDPITFPGQDGHLKEITTDQVKEICKFVAAHHRKIRRIIIHCKHGISRSSAVARAIAEAANVSFPSSYNEYNHYVYDVLRDPMHEAIASS
jgi:predicted protein tyrosine phosphatase